MKCFRKAELLQQAAEMGMTCPSSLSLYLCITPCPPSLGYAVPTSLFITSPLQDLCRVVSVTGHYPLSCVCSSPFFITIDTFAKAIHGKFHTHPSTPGSFPSVKCLVLWYSHFSQMQPDSHVLCCGLSFPPSLRPKFLQGEIFFLVFLLFSLST